MFARLILALVCVLPAASALAEIITFDFAGEFTTATHSVSVGDPITGSFRYDPATSNSGGNVFVEGPDTFTFDVNGQQLSFDFAGGDSYLFNDTKNIGFTSQGDGYTYMTLHQTNLPVGELGLPVPGETYTGEGYFESFAGSGNIRIDSFAARPDVPVQKVYLAFGHDAPFALSVESSISGAPRILAVPGATSHDTSLSVTTQNQILQEVQRLYADFENIEIMGFNDNTTLLADVRDVATVVYFAPKIPNIGLAGRAQAPNGSGASGLDWGNQRPNDQAIVLVSDSEEYLEIAQTVAHEIGHTFGLQHVDDSFSNQDVMFSRRRLIEWDPEFRNEIWTVSQFPNETHNPYYYLERHVNGNKDINLISGCMMGDTVCPGTYDLDPTATAIKLNLGNLDTNQILYNVKIRVDDGSTSISDDDLIISPDFLLFESDQITVGDLSNVVLKLPPLSFFDFEASTIPTGESNLVLSKGPLDSPENLFLPSSTGESFDINLLGSGLDDYVVLGSGSIVSVPEPATLLMLCIILAMYSMSRL